MNSDTAKQHSLIAPLAIQLIAISLLFSIASFVAAESNEYLAAQEPKWLQIATAVEDEKRPQLHLQDSARSVAGSWAFAFDNDVFVPGHRDQDYTYGINFTQTGPQAKTATLSLNNGLIAIDNWLGNRHSSLGQQEIFSRELGAFGFTPEDITISAANYGDRPYASLIYLSNSREQIDLVNNIAWKSTLTLGVLGLDAVGELQNVAHQSTDGTKAQGWHNQISEGGEVTGRYLLARQQYFDQLSGGIELKSTLQASIGYLTEASWGLSLRTGRIHSPWSSFNPELASYGEKSSYSSSAKAVTEHYFWTGFAIKARAYNVFLQGQFRNSPLSYQHHQLRPLLVEAWAGYTFAFKQGYRISYLLRGHSSELEHGAGNRNLLWGGIIIARNI